MTSFGKLVAIVLALRVFVPNAFLNQFYNYDLRDTGGNVFLKIHPGTYLIWVCAALSLTLPLRDGKALMGSIYIGVAAVLAALWCLIWGHVLSAGYLLDALLTAALALFCVARLSDSDREGVFRFLVAGVLLNAALAMVEFALKWRLMPYLYREPTFRPTALMNHPLTSGLVMAATVPVVMGLKRGLFFRSMLACFLLLAILATGARMASIGGVIAFVLSYLMVAKSSMATPDPRYAVMATLQALITTFLVPGIVVLAFLSGLGYRFASSLLDESSKTRIDAFRLLHYLDEKTYWVGAGAEALIRTTRALLGGKMESAVVVAIFQFGVPVAILFAVGCLLALRSVTKGGSPVLTVAAVTFVGVGLSNDALVGKTPIWAFILVVLAGARSLMRDSAPAPQAAAREKPEAPPFERPAPMPGSPALGGGPVGSGG